MTDPELEIQSNELHGAGPAFLCLVFCILCLAAAWDWFTGLLRKLLPCPRRKNKGTPDALIVAFAQGAQWWEYHKTGATMWASDRDQAEGEAETRAMNGTLGKLVNR